MISRNPQMFINIVKASSCVHSKVVMTGIFLNIPALQPTMRLDNCDPEDVLRAERIVLEGLVKATAKLSYGTYASANLVVRSMQHPVRPDKVYGAIGPADVVKVMEKYVGLGLVSAVRIAQTDWTMTHLSKHMHSGYRPNPSKREELEKIIVG
jgi:hypothetical protein